MSYYQTLFDRFNDWLMRQADLGYTALTCRSYLRLIQAFLHFLEAYGIPRLQDVSVALLQKFITTKPDHSPYKPKTILGRQAALALFYSWAFKHRFCSDNVFLRYRKAQVRLKEYDIALLDDKNGPDSLSVLSAKEQQHLLKTLQLATSFIESRTAAIMSLLLATGLHREEICQLTLQDFNWDKGTLTVATGRRKRDVALDKAFCEKPIKHWLHARQEILTGNACEWLFFTKRLKPLRPDKLTFYMKPFFEKAGIPCEKATADGLRQTAVYRWLRAGVPLEKIQVQFGFKQLASLKRYLIELKS